MSLANLGNAVTTMEQFLTAVQGGDYQTALDNLASAETAFNTMKTTKTAELQAAINAAISAANPEDVNIQGRYEYDLFVPGNPDEFKLVKIGVASNLMLDIKLQRFGDDDSELPGNPAQPGGGIVHLKSSGMGWSLDLGFLRTVVNFQTFREWCKCAGLEAFCEAVKIDAGGAVTQRNSAGYGFNYPLGLGLMLRANMNYKIITSSAVDLTLFNDGDIIGENASFNVRWLARTLNETDPRLVNGDSNNNHGTTYISYGVPA